MTDSERPQGRSRRRFLADMLFIGGGATAAAILAKSWTDSTLPPEPQLAPSPCPTTDQTTPVLQPDGPFPGNAVFPDHLVETPHQPEPPATLGEPAPQECQEPMVEGRTVAPKQ